MLDTADLGVAVSECRYDSSRFGPLPLRVAEVPCIETASGTCAGSLVSLEPTDPSVRSALQDRLERRLGHEVMWEVYAASYDRILPELSFYQEVVERHCAAMAAPAINTVLDLGAGTGSVTSRLLRSGKRVTAVDIGRAMLAKLYSKVECAVGRSADRDRGHGRAPAAPGRCKF